MLRFEKKTFGLIALILLISSCRSKDDSLGHDIPVRMGCRFTEGILEEPASGNINVAPSAFTPTEKDTLCLLGANNYAVFYPISQPDKPLKLKRGVWYKFDIGLFRSDNTSINEQFFKPDQIEKHQFFFNLMSGEKTIPNGISYYYSDMYNGELLASPLGFSGFIRIDKEVEDMSLRLMLVHLQTGDKYEANGKPNPFDKPSPRVLEFGDLTAFIPFVNKK